MPPRDAVVRHELAWHFARFQTGFKQVRLFTRSPGAWRLGEYTGVKDKPQQVRMPVRPGTVNARILDMAFSIKNPEADRLARQLSAMTGESLTEAVVQALRERLRRQGGGRVARRRIGDELARM